MSETLQPSPHLVPRRPCAEAYWSYSAVKETEIEDLVGWNRNIAHAGFSTHLHKMSQMAVLAEVQGNQLVSRCLLWLTLSFTSLLFIVQAGLEHTTIFLPLPSKH